MPRRPIQRLVTGLPPADLYKPAGVPMRQLETVELAIDELEAMRLVDHEGLSHEEAAHYLGVSRQTAGRVVESARRKVADALLGGKALAIGGGAYRVAAAARCCNDCGARWAVSDDDAAGDERCPSCGSTQVGVCRGFGPGHGHGRGRMQGGAGQAPGGPETGGPMTSGPATGGSGAAAHGKGRAGGRGRGGAGHGAARGGRGDCGPGDGRAK